MLGVPFFRYFLHLFRLSWLGLCTLIVSCDLINKLEEPKQEIKDPVKMVEVGVNSKQNQEFKHLLSYSFHISQSEITQSLFEDVMGFLPEDLTEKGDSLPIVQVSYYDAIRFCNLLSKQVGLDTVYGYESISQDSSGTTTSINSLQIFYKANGYRLPTELEWEIAAGINQTNIFGWGKDSSLASEYAWYDENSSGTLHEVCSKEASEYNLCDMSGNALEWMQDWMGPLPDTIPVNYVGPYESTFGQERVVKGGSYLSTINGLKIQNRKDIYSTFSSNRTNYIGFRVARGSISKPAFWGMTNGYLATTARPTFKAKRSSIISFFGTPFVKSIWSTEIGSLQWIDWSEDPVEVKTIPTLIPAYHPSISPDGKWVAWSTRREGQSGSSKIYIQPLSLLSKRSDSLFKTSAAIPRWWTDPATGLVYLIYATSAGSNSDVSKWEQESTLRVRIQEGKFVGPSEVVNNKGAYHGGLSSNGSTLLTSYPNLFSQNMQSNSRSLLFQSPQNGKPKNSSTQVCNASIAPQGAAQFLFLDFGETDSSSIVGSAYNIHQYIFRSDSVGKINWWLSVPEDRSGWDYTEWSNVNQFAVSASFGKNEARDVIHAIDLSSSKTIPLLKGIDFTHPNLWVLPVAEDFKLSPDSLCFYNYPSSEYKALFQSKMHTFWKIAPNLETALVGSSRILNGVNPDNLKDQVSFNFGYSGADLHSSIRFIRDYILPHCKKLKTIIFSLDIDLLCRKPDWFESRIGDSPGYQYDLNHNFWRDSLPKGFIEYTAVIPNQDPLTNDLGFGYAKGNSWGEKQQQILPDWNSAPAAWRESLDSLDSLLEDLEANEVRIFGVIFPQNPSFQAAETPYLYGPSSLEILYAIEKRLNALQSKYPQFDIIDFHHNGHHSFGDKYAANKDHLNTNGATILSMKLDSILMVDP